MWIATTKERGEEMNELITWLEMKIELHQKYLNEWEEWDDDEIRDQLEASIEAFTETLAKIKEIQTRTP